MSQESDFAMVFISIASYLSIKLSDSTWIATNEKAQQMIYTMYHREKLKHFFYLFFHKIKALIFYIISPAAMYQENITPLHIFPDVDTLFDGRLRPTSIVEEHCKDDALQMVYHTMPRLMSHISSIQKNSLSMSTEKPGNYQQQNHYLHVK